MKTRINNFKLLFFIILPLMLIIGGQIGYAQKNTIQIEKSKRLIVQPETSLTKQLNIINNKNILSMTLIIISLLLNALLVIAAIYFYKELKRIKKRRRKKKASSSEDAEAARVRLERKIDERLELQKTQLIKEILETIQEKFPAILSEVQNTTTPSINIVPKTLYATAVNGENATFFSVSHSISEEIIYRLDVDEKNKNKAIFSVEPKAYQWILKCPDYLENGCDLQNTGSMQVINEEAGMAEKKADGHWYVVKKAKVKFI